jgi:hypothetical protein
MPVHGGEKRIMSIRKLPVKTAIVKLTDEFEGWEFTARTNPPIKVFTNVTSGELDRIIRGLSKIILSWNFVNEEGASVADVTEDTIGDLPLDLLTAVANGYVGELNKLPKA